ncbi:MAG: ASCH domain-containing protein [Lachnospiraceae bacterium]|nr:ASCH domain-containing protein [Lachnospiraceae bacterium]
MDIEKLEKWHFELTEGACNYLLDLVLKGQKRATSSSVWGYEIEGEPIPQEGNFSVITDWDGNPGCVVKTTRVRIIPYKDITYEIAKLEGEDDSLESWRKKHEDFFREEGEELGYEFSEDMPVIFEEFEVVEKL